MRIAVPGIIALIVAACGSGTAERPDDAGATAPDSGTSPADGGDAGFDAGQQPTDIPLTVLYLVPDGGQPGGAIALAVQFSLGVGPLEAELDTGSSGLQLLADLLPPAALAAITPMRDTCEATFPQENLVAEGYLASAWVTIGDRTTPSSIPVIVYDHLSCLPDSTCPVSDGGALEPFLFNGYPALFGAGLRNGPADLPGVGSPIAQLAGSPSFIVEAPAFGGDAGILRIGPSPEEVASFQTFQLPADAGGAPLGNGTPGWNDGALPACVELISPSRQDYCADALLDTGTPEVAVYWTGLDGYLEGLAGSEFWVGVGPTTDPLGQFDVTVGAQPQYGWDLFLIGPPLPDFGEFLILGLPIFFRYDVLVDPRKGLLGLRPR